MSKRQMLLVGAVAAVTLIGVALLALLTKTPPDEAAPTPSSTVTSTATPKLTPQSHIHEGDVEEAHQKEGRANPVLRELPHSTVQWRLDFDGSQGDKYLLLATVNYLPGKDNPQAKIAEQRPFIEAYLRSIGQPDGTYIIEYQAESIETERNS